MLDKLKPTIAVLDSGIGGISVLNSLISKFKTGNYIYYADNLFMPYGTRTKRNIKNRVDYLIRLLKEKYMADIIIIACNTASSSIDIRNYKNVYVMQFNSKDKYLATNLTKENRPDLDVIVDRTLATLIEQHIDDDKLIRKLVKQHVGKYKLLKLNKLVLGCTHYELVGNLFKEFCPNTEIEFNSENLVNTIDFVPDNNNLTIKVLMSRDSNRYHNKIMKLIRR